MAVWQPKSLGARGHGVALPLFMAVCCLLHEIAKLVVGWSCRLLLFL